MALKASICIFLLRITVKQLHKWILYSVMAVTLLTGLVLSLVLLLQCRPLTYFWDKSLHGTCIDWQVIIAMSWLYSICAGTCDFTVGLLPIFLVWYVTFQSSISPLAVSRVLLVQYPKACILLPNNSRYCLKEAC